MIKLDNYDAFNKQEAVYKNNDFIGALMRSGADNNKWVFMGVPTGNMFEDWNNRIILGNLLIDSEKKLLEILGN